MDRLKRKVSKISFCFNCGLDTWTLGQVGQVDSFRILKEVYKSKGYRQVLGLKPYEITPTASKLRPNDFLKYALKRKHPAKYLT